jgi:DNA repair protein RadC
LGWHKISEGGIDGTVIDPRLIFSVALKGLACSIIIAHNHPSGNLQPSKQDIAITERIKQAGKLLGIQLQDHLILSNEGSFSFANEDRM